MPKASILFRCQSCGHTFESGEPRPYCPQGCRLPFEQETRFKDFVTTRPVPREAPAQTAKPQAAAPVRDPVLAQNPEATTRPTAATQAPVSTRQESPEAPRRKPGRPPKTDGLDNAVSK